MKIRFVNHASFIIEYKNVKIICDPWMEGTAFNNGWSLLSKTQLTYADFKDITHIWFSHEHPDHFSPPNLLKIPLEYRKKIIVLFQETIDCKVISFCKKLEFKEQVELPKNKFYTIEEDFKILCNPYTDGDSYALFKTDKHSLLNLNDCVVNTEEKAEELRSLVGKVDVLFTQFGYANKVGNIGDTELRKAASNEKLERIRIQKKVFNPKTIVPFASFVFFCHEENDYMNSGINKIEVVDFFIEQELKTQSVVLYPNDTWQIGEVWDSKASIEKYSKDYDKIKQYELFSSAKIDLAILKEEANRFIKKIKAHVADRHAKKLNAKIYLSDYGLSFLLSAGNGLNEVEYDQNSCDISLSSESLYYVFNHLWGGDTLTVNARFQTPPGGNLNNFSNFSSIASNLNMGQTFVFPTLLNRVRKKIQGSLKRFK